MKKSFIALFIAVLGLSVAVPALAKDKGEGRGLRLGSVFNLNRGDLDERVDADKFIVIGTVGSKTDGSLVINAKATVHVPTMTNNLVTVNVNSNTKISGNEKSILTLGDIKTGDQVIVIGTVSGSTLTAGRVQVNTPKNESEKKKALGEVTAKTTTDGVTSVTIKNNVTGTTQTVTVNDATKVRIDGETKTVADIAVGDSGWVKFKTKAGIAIARMFNLFR